MPEQAGCAMSGYLLVHDHSGVNQGGILSPTITGLAYREITNTLATCINYNNVTKSTASTTYVKLKEMMINVAQNGSLAVTYDAYVTGGTGYYDIRKNGVSMDIQSETSIGTPIGHSYVLAGPFAKGDLISIWVHRSSTFTAFVEAMTLEYGWRLRYFGDGTKIVLTAPLALSDTDTLSVTNQDP